MTTIQAAEIVSALDGIHRGTAGIFIAIMFLAFVMVWHKSRK